MSKKNPAIVPGRIVHYRLTEHDTLSPDRVGKVAPAMILNVRDDGTADLGVTLNGRVDLPSVVQFEPEARRAPMILAPVLWVGGVSEGKDVGQYEFPNRG